MLCKTILFLLILSGDCQGWWSSSNQRASPNYAEGNSEGRNSGNAKQTRVNFEVLSAEEKFLAQAKQYMDLSPLDLCHQKVVDQIQKSCGDITEEELAKLSVALLNCQSESEGRPLFECSEHMSIAECTSAMDPHVWNAYHIISNRARSVCYATRQQLFRHRTEVAVNRLALSTQDQLASMAVLREGQVEVHEATKAALTSVQEGQVELAGQQGRLRAAHAQLQASVSVNLGELGREKSMIAQSQEQLMNMTESVLSKLENATSQLEDQGSNSRQQHVELMEDLGQLRSKARQVWDKIDESLETLSALQEQTSAQYHQTLEDLRQINATVHYILTLTNSLDHSLNDQLTWLMEHVGGATKGLSLVTLLVGHAAFLLLSALVLMFVQAPVLPRVALLVLVVVNALAALQWGGGLNLSWLGLLLAAITAGDWCVCVARRGHLRPRLMLAWPHRSKDAADSEGAGDASYSPDLHSASLGSSMGAGTDTPLNQLTATPSLDHTMASELQDLVDDMTTEEYSSFSGHMSASDPRLVHPQRIKCQAVTRGGTPCKLNHTAGSLFCRRHTPLNR